MGRHRALGRFADVLIAGAVLLTVWRLADGFRTSPSLVPPLLARGATLAIPGIDWSSSHASIVVLAASGCPACGESVAFYRVLEARAQTVPGVRLVMLSFEPGEAFRTWLQHSQIDPSRATTVPDVSVLGFSVTPTVLLVDSHGTVTDVLERKLSEADEARFLGRVDGVDATPLDNTNHATEIRSDGLADLRLRGQVTILDVRSRTEFANGHIQGAVNIPLDELKSRAPIEVVPTWPVVVDCGQGPIGLCRSAGRLVQDLGFRRVSLLLPGG